MMEREEVYTLMMDALDGELSEAGWERLEAHLRVRPELAREWEALQAVEQLFRETGLAVPPAGFVERTVRRLPGVHQRLWVGVLVYAFFLASGILPLLGLGWLAVQFVPALGQPALWTGLWQALSALLVALGIILRALVGGMAEYLVQQPALFGWLFVMIAVVLLWGGVYNRLVLQSPRS